MKNTYGTELMIRILQTAGEPDAEEKARRLYERFGGFSSAADTGNRLLMTEGGLSERSVVLLKLLTELARRKRCQAHRMPRTVNDPALYDALQARYFGRTGEVLTVIAADAHGRILEITEIGCRRSDRVDVRVTQVLEFAWNARAAKLVLAHNHPDGFAIPSAADAASQRVIREIAGKADIEVCDHIIIAEDGYVRMQP